MSAQDLPVDVLLPIFHLCLEGPFPPSNDPLHTTRSLSQVCTSWRRIFLSDMRWQAIGEARTTALSDGRERRMSVTHLVQGENRSFDPLDIPLPWSYVASLDLHTFPVHPRVALRLFHNSRATLVEAYLRIDAQAQTTITIMTSVLAQPFPTLQTTLRRLTKVHLIILDDANGGEDDLTDLLTLAHLPRLKHLRLEARSHHIEQLDLIHSLPTPSSTIRHLSDYTFPPPPTTPRRHLTYPNTEHLFHSIPNARFLRLPRCVLLRSPTLSKLETGVLLPCLQVLEAGENVNVGPLYPISSVRLSMPEADARFFVQEGRPQRLEGLEGVEVTVQPWS
ncbi:hypothetical protein NLJ89_g4915 [Agrocybe chaxingu]|uniref:F-box domain-containing protein n=1 Tax=Agrocybe chaxingu TaxID=84603 RepID=A0A9W8JZK0_9AGAR|nr:hypothetical protein NLJ89_g4915 [Agrocybe chaxingu]